MKSTTRLIFFGLGVLSARQEGKEGDHRIASVRVAAKELEGSRPGVENESGKDKGETLMAFLFSPEYSSHFFRINKITGEPGSPCMFHPVTFRVRDRRRCQSAPIGFNPFERDPDVLTPSRATRV